MTQSSFFDQQFEELDQFALDVQRGLNSQPKTLPCKFLYDAVGSALFDAITHLQEYGCTRGEKRLLESSCHTILSSLDLRSHIVELGGGTGEKALLLLSGAAHRRVEYHNVDISETAIELSANLLKSLPSVVFHGHVGDFLSGLQDAVRDRKGKVMVMFMGSSIGNFNSDDAQQFLRSVKAELKTGDQLLLGTDLVKPIEQLLLAYDDPQGVTSAFNKNLLARLNHSLGANFDLKNFEHEARWNEEQECVEMHLRCLSDHVVRIVKLQSIFRFSKDETIRTERSHKYSAENVDVWLRESGWTLKNQWIDRETLFALNLAEIE